MQDFVHQQYVGFSLAPGLGRHTRATRSRDDTEPGPRSSDELPIDLLAVDSTFHLVGFL